MKYKKEYSQPVLEFVEIENVLLLAASFDEMMDTDDVIDDSYEIL